MNILLTGHKGFIGSHLLQALKQANHSVIACDWGDELPSIQNLDWVIHIGAISSTTERDLDRIMRQNVDYTQMLYDACCRYGVNFQFASSASVYGLNQVFREHAPLDPRTPYAWSKYLCEHYIANNASTARAQIFRYFNVYGPEGEEHKGSQASPHCQFKQQAKTQGQIKVFAGSENYCRDFIHIDQIVKYHLEFLNCPDSGIFNLGTGQSQSFLSVAEQFQVPIVEIAMPDSLKCSYQTYTCADMSKTLNALGLRMSTSKSTVNNQAG